ncbi:MAG: DUF4358 domain-containing protein [Bilifractor sp.]
MKNNNTTLTMLEIVKWALVALIAAFILHSLMGNRISSADFDSVWNAVTSKADTSKMQEGDNQMIRRLYGLDPAQFDEIRLDYPKTNMGAEEILLVRLKKTDDQEMVRTAMESRKKTQMNNFNGYGTYQYAMLEKSQIVIRGNYALFVSAEDSAGVVQAFESAL